MLCQTARGHGGPQHVRHLIGVHVFRVQCDVEIGGLSGGAPPRVTSAADLRRGGIEAGQIQLGVGGSSSPLVEHEVAHAAHFRGHDAGAKQQRERIEQRLGPGQRHHQMMLPREARDDGGYRGTPGVVGDGLGAEFFDDPVREAGLGDQLEAQPLRGTLSEDGSSKRRARIAPGNGRLGTATCSHE